MSYEPTLIIRKNDLEKNISILEEEQYSNEEDTNRVAKYLLNVNKNEIIKFDELELILCTPEPPTFNCLIRVKLEELDVDFRVDN